MPSRMFNHGMFEIINQQTNWDTADNRVLLVNAAYAFNPDSNFVSDIVANEIATTNYSRQVLANTTIVEDDTGDSVILDADDVPFAALGPPSGGPIVGGAIEFRNTGADGTSPLINFSDLTDTQVNGGTFTVAWDSAGIIVSTSP